jgi:hypothetical protein
MYWIITLIGVIVSVNFDYNIVIVISSIGFRVQQAMKITRLYKLQRYKPTFKKLWLKIVASICGSL